MNYGTSNLEWQARSYLVRQVILALLVGVCFSEVEGS